MIIIILNDFILLFLSHKLLKRKIEGQTTFLGKILCYAISFSCCCCKDVAAFQCKCMQESRMRYLEAKSTTCGVMKV